MKIAYIGIDLLYPAIEEFVKSGCEIMKIFSCITDNKTEFNLDIISFAQKNNIPYTLDKIVDKDIENLIKQGCNLIVCAGYYYKLPVNENIPMINIHPTFLPIGRGGWPMPIIIKEKFIKSGVSIHKVSNRLDEGDLIIQEEFYLDKKEDLKTYMKKVYNALPKMINTLISNFDYLYENAKKQADGIYFNIPDEKDYTVYDDMIMEDADLILRAFFGYEVIYKNKDKTYEIIEGVISQKHNDDEYHYFNLKDGYIKALNFNEII